MFILKNRKIKCSHATYRNIRNNAVGNDVTRGGGGGIKPAAFFVPPCLQAAVCISSGH